MGVATRGGGAVENGAGNKPVSEPSKTTGPVKMAKGGKPVGKMGGGMMSKGYAAGGAAKKTKGHAAGGKRAK